MTNSQTIDKAVDMLASLPSIGKRTAQRLAFFMLRQSEEYVSEFANSIIELKNKVKLCPICFNYTDKQTCSICSSEKRNKATICVVEEPTDIVVIEKTHEYFGLYHVLHGKLNPLEGIGAEDIRIKELMARSQGLDEVILALNPSIEGEVTTQYIAKLMKPLEIKVSRIASGVPVGSSLEYTDEATLSKALEGRIYL